MIKIGEVKGEKGFFKQFYAEGYYGTFDFKLKFEGQNSDVEIKNNTMIFCNTDEMTIEIWADAPNLKTYKFLVRTYKIEEF